MLVHDLVRDAARGFLHSASLAHKRAASYYHSKRDNRSALEALYHYVMGGLTDEAISIIETGANIADEGYLEPFIHLVERLLATSSPQTPQDTRLRRWLLAARAWGFERTQNELTVAKRLVQEAERIGRECGDIVLTATAFLIHGYILDHLGDTRGCERLYTRALKNPAIRHQRPLLAIWIMDGLSNVMMSRGRLKQAIELEAQAAKLSIDAGDPRNLAFSKVKMGIYHCLMGNYGEALSILFSVKTPLTNKFITMFPNMAIGLTLVRLPDKKEQGLVHLRRAIRLSNKTKFRIIFTRMVSEETILRIRMEDIKGAHRKLKHLTKLRGNLKRRYSQGLLELATGVVRVGDQLLPEALEHFRNARKLFSEDMTMSGRVLWWMTLTTALRGDSEASIQLLTETRRIFQKMDANPLVKAETVISRLRTEPLLSVQEALSLAW